MAGTLKVDNLNADSNIALRIANTAVGYIDSTGLRIVNGNLVLSGTTVSSTQLSQLNANGTISASGIASVNASTVTSGTLPAARLPSGSALQVVQFTTTDTVSMSSGAGFANTGFNVVITPSSSSNKVLIMGMTCVYVNGTGGEPHVTIYRNGTNIGGSSGFTDQYNSAGNLVSMHPFVYLDSPSSTSAVAYSMYARLDTTGTAYFGANNCKTVMIAMEIVG
jgi:hypothetical protein